MAANSYDLSSLNGVVFTDNEISLHGDGGSLSGGPAATGYSGSTVTIGSNTNQYAATENFIVTGYDNAYTPGGMHANSNGAGDYDYLPTFGTITVAKYDGLGGGFSGLGDNPTPGAGTTLYVHGFEDNGQALLVSAYKNLYFYTNFQGEIVASGGPSTQYNHTFALISNVPLSTGAVSLTFDNNGSTFHAAPTPAGPTADPNQGLGATGGSGGTGLSSVNGVTFHGTDISFGNSTYPSSGIQLDMAGTSGSTVTVQSIESIKQDTNPITVTSVTPAYTHGKMGAAGVYFLPTFGTITTNTELDNQAPKLYVHGYESNGQGLLVSNYKYVGFVPKTNNAGVTYLIPEGNNTGAGQLNRGYIGILSNVDLGGGRTSPGYGMPQSGFPAGSQPADGNPHPLNSVVTGDSFPLVFDTTSVYTPPCFAEGTHILTRRGEVKVENLRVGDIVYTVPDGLRPVVWIGSRQVNVARHPRPHEVNPILIREGAFDGDLPVRDLRLSPGHAVHVDDVLVPAGYLINGATIVQEAVESIRYFHVELDDHDVLLAEALPCESYLDDGNREAFSNAPEHTALHGKLDPTGWDGACAPVVRDRRLLNALQQRLHARAEALGWTRSADGGLSLVADGAALTPLHAAGPRRWFVVPACKTLTLVSDAGRLCDLVAGCEDDRRLGVAVSEVRVDGATLDLAQALGAGAYGLEGHDGLAWRWTDGAATLEVTGPALVEIAVHMAAPAWIRPADARRVEAV